MTTPRQGGYGRHINELMAGPHDFEGSDLIEQAMTAEADRRGQLEQGAMAAGGTCGTPMDEPAADDSVGLHRRPPGRKGNLQ